MLLLFYPKIMEDDLITLVIERAEQKIPSPYVRWGIGEDGFDCSGFWYSIFSQLWIVFPSRFTAAMFSSHSRKISKNQIRRGDFMFWDQKPWSKKHNPIYHIEMVVSAPFMRYGKSYVKTLGSSSSKGIFDIKGKRLEQSGVGYRIREITQYRHFWRPPYYLQLAECKKQEMRS